MNIKHIITAEEDKQRLDQILAKLSGWSRSQIQNSIEMGNILINGKVIKKKGLILKENDLITAKLYIKNHNLKAENIELEIIMENNDYLVINKAPGIVVHPNDSGHSDGTVLNALLAHTKLSKGSSQERPGIVHRLDKDTSGVLIIAKNNETHEKLAKAFHDRKVEKHYIALVKGHMKSNKGRIDAPLRRSSKKRTQMAIHRQGKRAITNFEIISEYKDSSLLKINIETGRTHQIRVHMAGIGHPIVGDKVYGDKNFNLYFKNKFGLERQFLHAYSMGIIGKKFKAELWHDLENTLIKLKKV